MARVPIVNRDSPGFSRDAPAITLPPEVWTTAQGVRFQDGVAERLGTAIPAGIPNDPLPTQIFAFKPYAQDPRLLLCTASAIWSTNGIATTNVTGLTVPNAPANGWTFTNFNGIPVLNDGGVSVPQVQTGIPTSVFVNLPNWPATYRAAVMRSFKNFLIGLNIKKDTTQYPNLVKWSDVTDPGTVPGSWNEADPTTLAGENALASNDDDDDDTIVDGGSLRDLFMIYKHTSAHAMRLAGNNIFAFTKAFDKGAMNQNCIVRLPTDEARHLVVGIDDIYVNNGFREETILERRIRRWLFNQIDPTKSNLVHAAHHPAKREVWVAYPALGASRANTALVWQYVTNSVSIVDLFDTHALASAPFQSPDPSDIWDGNDTTWDGNELSWDPLPATALRRQLLQATPTGVQFLDVNTPSQYARLERLGLSIAGRDQSGRPIFDTEVRKLVRGMHPRFEGFGMVTFTVGASDTPSSAIRWGAPKTFNVATQKQVDCFAEGHVLHVRFEATDVAQWRMIGYDLEIEVAGER